jgi:carboxypeptidase Taq
MEAKLQELKKRLTEIEDLASIDALLMWEQTTYMPDGGAEARGRQMATLAGIKQEKCSAAELGTLLDDLLPYAHSLPADSDDAALITVAKRDFDLQVRIPVNFMTKLTEQRARTYQAWTEARPKSDFAAVEPELQKILDYSREWANYFPGYEHIADPLIDASDYGMKVSSVRHVFAELRKELVPLVEAITAQPETDDSCLKQFFPEKEQIDFANGIVKQFGYNFDRGRCDKSPHPFTTKFSVNDVRITTRVKEYNFNETIFSTLHEGGHAMYEQGISQSFEGLPLANGTSAGVHESQSRLWENIVGRSLGFWRHYYPQLQQVFSSQLGSVSLDTFYKAINKVSRSLIRTDADEVTYNLHVMIRFDLELELLEGKLAVKDLPEAWNERFRQDLGIVPPDHNHGCLQDVHWYDFFVGGVFQGYTLGNILSGLFYSQAVKASPQIPQEIEHGKFASLYGWMKDNIYQYGRKYTASELIERTTGGSLRVGPYIQYLKEKYGTIYKI